MINSQPRESGRDEVLARSTEHPTPGDAGGARVATPVEPGEPRVGVPLVTAPDVGTDRVDDSRTTWNPEPEPSRLRKGVRALRWLPGLVSQRAVRWRASGRPAHVVVAVADHYEPAYVPRLLRLPTSESEQEARVERWCRQFRETADEHRDVNGFPFVHTYFLPAEEWYPSVVERLVDFARSGYGEIEIQLHHGVWHPDTAERTRETLVQFRDVLVAHGCLSRWDGTGPARYGFVHGNWALANSNCDRYCGVDNELEILADTGCYADFTLPSAPNPSQVSKTNSIYECTLPFDEPAPHRMGRDLTVGRPPQRYPIIVQGPLALYIPRDSRHNRMYPRIENGEISQRYRPTPQRIEAWRRAAITVHGRPDWVFVKLHCHGLEEVNFESLIGPERRELLHNLVASAESRGDTLHYVSAREMVNIALAACDGREGSPSDYRDYRLQPIGARR
jgi:hypothetical protein